MSAAAAAPLIQYWDDGRPPDDVAALLDAVGHANPGMRQLVFDRAGAETLIAERFSARELAAFRACAVPAMQADYFRYCAAHALGGAYVDADFRPLGPLWPLLGGARDGLLFGRAHIPRGWPADLFGDRERVGPYWIVANSVFLLRAPGHPLARLAIDVATANVERRVCEDVAAVTGPGVFTSVYLLDRLGSFDAFLEFAAAGALAPSARLFCEVVGDPGRAAEALDGIRVAPFECTREALLEVVDELEYKSTEVHWRNRRGSIFSR